jgi:hypothetical protein
MSILTRDPPKATPKATPSLESVREAVATLRQAAAETKAKIEADPDAVVPLAFDPNLAAHVQRQQGKDAARAADEAIRGEPLSILAERDLGRVARALGPALPIQQGSETSALDIVGRMLADLEGKEIQAQYDAEAPKLRKLDLAVAKALLAFRDAWETRVAASQKIRRPGLVTTRPQLRVAADLNQIVQALRSVKNAEDLL